MSPFPSLSASGGAPAVFPDPTPVWQQRFRGLRWTDMPGTDSDLKKIHFALWRRGLVKVITDGAAPTGWRLGGRLLPAWGLPASEGDVADRELDVSAVAHGEADGCPGQGGAPEGEAPANAKAAATATAKAEAEGKVNLKAGSKTAAGRAAARRRRMQRRLSAMRQQGEPAAVKGSRKKHQDLLDLLYLAERIRVAAEAAGLTMQEAGRLGRISCCSLKPSQLARSGPKHRARMAALLEKLVQINHKGKEGA